MYIWEVYEEDLSHLGGAMGTEYTTQIDSKLFSDKGKAFNYIILRSRKSNSPIKILDEREKYWDLGNIGLGIRKKKIN